MQGRVVCGVAAAATLAGSACAQIATIGQFTGPYTEGFETQAALRDTPYQCLPGRIFNGTADICDPQSSELIIPQFWSLFCQASPHAGARYVVGLSTPLEITFDQAVNGFGGYFATVGGQDGGEVVFFNGATQIATLPFTTSQCTYTWSGWQSTAPFTRVRIIGNSSFGDGGYIHMDDLEYRLGTGPAPCYPNCDGSTAAPTLNVADFGCFLQRYASGAPYANCDGSTAAPVLNVSDFTCFLQKFAAGCP
jgi:hypothetical protein